MTHETREPTPRELMDAIQGLGRAMDSKFNRLQSDMGQGFAMVANAFAGIEIRFAGVEARFSGVDARFSGLETRLLSIESSMATKDDIARFERRIIHIDDRVSALEAAR